MARRLAPFTPKAYERGAWIVWTDADGVTRNGQIIDQGPQAGTWWITSLTPDTDQLETYLLNRLLIRTKYDRMLRDKRVAAGGDSHLYQVNAAAYALDERGDMRAVIGDAIAPAVSCDEPQAEALARNGQTLIPLDDAPAETAGTAETLTEGAAPMATVSAPRTPSVAVARELRRLGLVQGPGKDFRVVGAIVKGERDHTYVLLLTADARQLVADRADDLEAWLAAGPFPFKVSVRYHGSDRPMPSIHNGAAERIRDERPAAVEAAPVEEAEELAPVEEVAPAAPVEDVEEPAPAAVDAPTAPAVDEPAEDVDTPQEPAQPVIDHNEQYKQQCQAAALCWSTKQAAHVRAAAAGHLFRDDFADAFRWSTDRAKTGRRVSGSFLAPLQAAGFLALTEAGADGRRVLEATADGRRGILVWDQQQPEPTVRNHKQERMPLTPLMWGEEAARRTREFNAQEEERRVKRDAWWAGHQEATAAEEQEDKLRAAWAKAEGIRNPCSRRPKGWAPTAEQIAEHRLDPTVVAALLVEAADIVATATEAAAAEPAGSTEPTTDTDPWGHRQPGDIVAIDGRPGDWELMARAVRVGVWEVEPAQASDRERTTAETAALLTLDDAPHVRRGDLVLQHYPEQTQAATVGDVYRLGRWVAVKEAVTPDGETHTMRDDVDTLEVVTREQLDRAVRLDVEAGDHHGRIVEVIVSRHAGTFRVVCGCLQGLEVCRAGRKVGYSSSVEAARALWEWHAAGQVGPAPEDFAAPAPLPAPRAARLDWCTAA
ncbi:hypothetical protein ACFY7V_03620 [[Kitasatospora] papulosa]|uniref:hypothetical protein n=1 Tax=Streptomyces TaxID=1883 RepID=UPI002FF25663